MRFESGNAKMWYENESSTVFMEGTFRLSTEEYGTMSGLLMKLLEAKPSALNLDLTGLEFLNSSGINVIAKLVIAIRNASTTKLTIQGSKSIPWQSKSLPNLKKIHPALQLDIA